MEAGETSSRALRKSKRTFIINRRARVMTLYFQRKTQQQIAIELAMSPTVVFEDIKATIAAYKRHYSIDTMVLIVEEIERINRLEAQAAEAYEKSCQKKTVATAANNLSGPSSSATVIERGEGDPAFLRQIENCIKLRIKLLRLDKRDGDDKAGDADLGMSLSKIFAAYWDKKERQEVAVQPSRPLELGDGDS